MEKLNYSFTEESVATKEAIRANLQAMADKIDELVEAYSYLVKKGRESGEWNLGPYGGICYCPQCRTPEVKLARLKAKLTEFDTEWRQEFLQNGELLYGKRNSL